MKTRLMQTAVCASALFVAALFAAPVHADGLTLTGNSPVITEGDTGLLVLTLSNESSDAISFSTADLLLKFESVAGDDSDAINSFVLNNSMTTCGSGLGIGATCKLVVDLGTPSGAGETDGDFGLAKGNASLEYDVANIGTGYYVHSPDFTVTVNDVGVSKTPEPSSLLLLGSGLLGMLGLSRKRLI